MSKAKKTLVEYKLLGDKDKVLAEGVCVARTNRWQMQDICDHAGVEMSDVWSMETTQEA